MGEVIFCDLKIIFKFLLGIPHNLKYDGTKLQNKVSYTALKQFKISTQFEININK